MLDMKAARVSGCEHCSSGIDQSVNVRPAFCRVTILAGSVHIACPFDMLQPPRANGALESRRTMTASVHVSRVMRSARAAMYMCASCAGPMYAILAYVTERERGRFRTKTNRTPTRNFVLDTTLLSDFNADVAGRTSILSKSRVLTHTRFTDGGYYGCSGYVPNRHANRGAYTVQP